MGSRPVWRSDTVSFRMLPPGPHPQLPLTVSHMWDGMEHPDPSNSQIEAVCSYLEDIWEGRADKIYRRRGGVPMERVTLRELRDTCHPGPGLEPLLDVPAIGGVQTAPAPASFQQFLSQIAVWYDFCSLPQSPRSISDEKARPDYK